MDDQMMDVDPGNVVDDFGSLVEAIFAVHDAVDRFGQARGDGLALSENDDAGGGRLPGIGVGPLRLAQSSTLLRVIG